MSSIFSKFGGEQDPAHGGRLFWPGSGDFPFRGATAPTLKESERDDVDVVQDFHCDEFNLSDPERRKAYQAVMDRVVNGWFVCYYRDIVRDPATGVRTAYVEWTQRYGQYTPGSSGGSAIARVG